MSKQSAMNMATGSTASVASPSLVAGSPPVDATVSPVEGTVTQAVEAPRTLDSDRFAKLARKESQLVKEREEFKKEKEWVSERKQRWDKFEQTKSQDPVEALKMVGFTDTEIFNALSGSVPKEITPEERAAQIAKEQIEAYKKEVETQKVTEQQAADKRTLTNFKNRITNTLSKDPDKYEISLYNGKAAEDLIYETMLVDAQNLKEGEQLMSLEEAAEEVEEYYKSYFEGARSLKKLTPQQVEEIKEEIKQQAPIQKSKTLTNAAAPTVAATVNTGKRESREEKRERLINQVRMNGLVR